MSSIIAKLWYVYIIGVGLLGGVGGLYVYGPRALAHDSYAVIGAILSGITLGITIAFTLFLAARK